MILATALLEILSVLPAKETVRTDETFAFTVRVRNAGPDAAQDVKLRAGGNQSVLLHGIEGPPKWTCDAAGPRFTAATTCTTATFPAKAEAEFTVKVAAPQPTAMTYRIGAALSAKGVATTRREMNLTLVSSPSQSELTMAARKLNAERAAFDIRNGGPKDAKAVLVVIENAALASGKGWSCAPTAHGVACTRPVMRPGTRSTIEARGKSATIMSARVRAELNLEERPHDNTARP